MWLIWTDEFLYCYIMGLFLNYVSTIWAIFYQIIQLPRNFIIFSNYTYLFFCWPSKGQLISKANCQAVNSSKKTEKMNSFLLLCDVFSFVFWKKLKTPKKPFEIIWPLKSTLMCWRNLRTAPIVRNGHLYENIWWRCNNCVHQLQWQKRKEKRKLLFLSEEKEQVLSLRQHVTIQGPIIKL